MIRPADGAVLEPYYPWREYQNAIAAGSLPAYAELLSISNDIKSIGTNTTIDSGTVRKILDWCSRNGLLGLLHRETAYVRLAATEKQNDLDGETYSSHATYFHEGGSWTEGNIDVGKEKLEPAVLVRSASGPKEVNLAEGWGKYFYTVAAEEKLAYQYPHPETEAFWQQYSEPLAMFLMYVKQFDDAVNTLALVKGDNSVFEELGFGSHPAEDEELNLLPDTFPTIRLDLSEYDQDAENVGAAEGLKHGFVLAAMDGFNNLLAGSNMQLSANEFGNYIPRVYPSSLLSFLSASCMEDLLFGVRNLVRCASPNCNNIVFTENPNQAYCSMKCKKREEMKRYRAKRRKKKSQG